MRDIERELRALGERSRNEDQSRSALSGTTMRRIRLHRLAAGTTGLVVALGLVLGGSFVAGALDSNDRGIGPAQASPSASASSPDPSNKEAGRCGPPVDFRPTYLPDGWIEDLQRGDGGGGGWRGIVGHFGNDAERGTTDKADGGFADLIASERPYQQGNTEKIRVLDAPATLGDIHEGYSVEFTQYGCDYFLIAFGISRDELRRFAEGLRLPGTYVPGEPAEESFAAIWPEDTAEEAEQRCRRHSRTPNVWSANRVTTAGRFSADVLMWEEPLIRYTPTAKEVQKMEIRRSENDDGPRARGPAVIVYLTEFVPRCWSVVSVGRLPDDKPTGLSITVRGKDVEIGFDDLGADSIYFEIGHGYYTNSSGPEPPDGRITAHLRYPRGETGHFLLLFKDENGDVFSAAGGPLPAGDFSAG